MEGLVDENCDAQNHPGDALWHIIKQVRSDDAYLAPGSHNLFVYDDLPSLERFYCEYAAKWLPKNEIVLIGTQYQTEDRVKKALSHFGIDVSRYMGEGSLLIIDAQRGYLPSDIYGTFKLVMTLVERAKKEGRHGVSWIGDGGSFISFCRIDDLMKYELSCPQKFDDEMLRAVCCYHEGDFSKLAQENRDILQKHHMKCLVAR